MSGAEIPAARFHHAPPTRTGYSGTQFALHWIIAVPVVVQVVAHEGIEAAFGAAQPLPVLDMCS